MVSQVISARYNRASIQPGSMPKTWDKEELRRCGAIETALSRELTLKGDIHPVFTNWVDVDPELHKELEQPLLLASRMLEAAGLPWISDFLAHDVFAGDYPGRQPSCRCSFTHSAAAPGDSSEVVPRTIVRHHRAPWASSELRDEWLQTTECQLKEEMARAITWQLDADMFHERGWVGYTCRHPRNGLQLDELDKYETIKSWDRDCKEDRWRNLTVLVTAEFPARLAELRRQGKEHSEEYLLTAFMAAVTILHELGHAVYWKDCRALTRDLGEPFYGGDLQMELGDSFVASIFGGWLPVPIQDPTQNREDLNFSEGLAWRQSLNWDFHRIRPKHRAHYSIPVDYVARLFSEEGWREAHSNPLPGLIRPQALELVVKDVGIYPPVSVSNEHATAAIPDFHCTGQGWMWNRLPGARFRIPQYDGYLCPDLDLPIATDDVIEEPKPRPQLQPSPIITAATTTTATVSPSLTPTTPTIITKTFSDDSILSSPQTPETRLEMFPLPPRWHANEKPKIKIKIDPRREYSERKEKKQATPRYVKLAEEERNPLSPDRSEISLDDLRNRLSRLLDVSLGELERYFEASRCA